MSDLPEPSKSEVDSPAEPALRKQTITFVYISQDEYDRLKAELETLSREKRELSEKYIKVIEKKEIEHAKEVERLKNEIKELNSTIEDLENKIRSLEESNTFLKAKIDENERKFEQILDSHERKFKRIEDKMKRDRYMLLVGSIGYNFIDSLTQFVFGRKRLIELRPKLRTVDAIRREKKTEKEEERWKTYQDYWSGYEDYVDTYEEYLHKFTMGRVELVHPLL